MQFTRQPYIGVVPIGRERELPVGFVEASERSGNMWTGRVDKETSVVIEPNAVVVHGGEHIVFSTKGFKRRTVSYRGSAVNGNGRGLRVKKRIVTAVYRAKD